MPGHPEARRSTSPHEASRSTSFAITPQQLAWLDAQRHHGSISRSAALRQAIDRLIALDANTATPERIHA